MTAPTILRVNGEAWWVEGEHQKWEPGEHVVIPCRVWLRYPLAVDGEGEPVRCPNCLQGALSDHPWTSPLCLHGWERMKRSVQKFEPGYEPEELGPEDYMEPPIRMTADEALDKASLALTALGLSTIEAALVGHILGELRKQVKP